MPDLELALFDESGRALTVARESFLLFVDETGSETLSDPQYPIFGLGACGVPASIYLSNIAEPWRYFKRKEFGGENVPLHAAGLKPTNAQLQGFSRFFGSYHFGRMAAVLSDRTAFETNVDIYHLTVRVFLARVLEVLKYTQFEDIVMIIEASDRTDRLAREYFDRYPIQRTLADGTKRSIEFAKFRMGKSSNEPGLEVADFIAHTAGASVRDRLAGKRSKEKERKDFALVFKEVDSRLTSFVEITSCADTPPA